MVTDLIVKTVGINQLAVFTYKEELHAKKKNDMIKIWGVQISGKSGIETRMLEVREQTMPVCKSTVGYSFQEIEEIVEDCNHRGEGIKKVWTTQVGKGQITQGL